MKTFVTVGLERLPFDRLIRLVDKGIRERRLTGDVFVQSGHCRIRPGLCPSSRFLSFDEMTQAVKAADIIIAHGGVGTFLLCQRLGKPPILFPRVSRLGEHIDDHQMEFTEIMMRRRMALAAFDEEGLWKAHRDYQDLSADLVREVAPDTRSGLSGHLNLILSQRLAQKKRR